MRLHNLRELIQAFIVCQTQMQDLLDAEPFTD